MPRILFPFLVAMLFVPGIAFPQKRIVDSLENVCKTSTSDTVKIKALHALAWRLKDTDPVKAAGYLDKILVIIEQPQNAKDKEHLKFFTRYKANAHLIHGLIYTRQSKYTEAMKEQQIAMELGKQFNETPIIADACCNIGIVYYMQGNFPKALQNYLDAMRAAEGGTDKRRIGNLCNNIGGIYIHMADTNKAWEFFDRSLKINREINNRNGIANASSNLGLILKNRGKLDEAKQYFTTALMLALEIQNTEKEAACYDNLSTVFFLQNKIDSSLEYNEKAIVLYKEIEDHEGLGTVYANMASTYLKLKQYNKALGYLIQAEKIGKEISGKFLLQDVEKQLTELYELMGKNKEAFESYKAYIVYRDSLSNEENTKKMVQADMQYEFDKKEEAAHAEQEKRDAVTLAEKKKQQVILWSISGIGLLVLGFAFFAYRSFLQKKKANIEISKQKHIIEEKQKEILDSIYYARRIQRSLITGDHYIHKHLKRLNP